MIASDPKLINELYSISNVGTVVEGGTEGGIIDPSKYKTFRQLTSFQQPVPDNKAVIWLNGLKPLFTQHDRTGFLWEGSIDFICQEKKDYHIYIVVMPGEYFESVEQLRIRYWLSRDE